MGNRRECRSPNKSIARVRGESCTFTVAFRRSTGGPSDDSHGSDAASLGAVVRMSGESWTQTEGGVYKSISVICANSWMGFQVLSP